MSKQRPGTAVRALPAGVDGFIQKYLDALPCAFVELDRKGCIVRSNVVLAALLGYSTEELAGKDWFEITADEVTRSELRTVHQRLMRGEGTRVHTYENYITSRDGKKHLLRWSNNVLVDDTGEIVGTSSSGLDITSQQDEHDELKKASRRVRDLEYALNASAIVAITDARGVITHVNDKFVEISKYSRDELLGRTHKMINSGHHPKSFFKDMWETIESGRVWKGDIKNKAKDGSFYWVSTTIVPFVNADGDIYQYLAIRHEITERKLAERALTRAVQELEKASDRDRQRVRALESARDRIREEQTKLVQAEKLSSIGLLAAGVAHEVNNPLAGVLNCIKALQAGDVDEEKQREYLEASLEGLERIRTIVRGLLDFARPQRGSDTEVDAARLVESVRMLLAATLRKERVSVEVEIEPDTVLFFGDRQKMMQAVLNVLLNATQASPPDSVIHVRAEQIDDFIVIRFQDEGPGVDPAIISKLCDPFFTTKDEGEGTGLGLTVTQGILNAHGGRIEIANRDEGGTEVSFWLPRTP